MDQLVTDIEEKCIELIVVHHASVITPNTTFLRRFKESVEEIGAKIYDTLEKGDIGPHSALEIW